MSELKSIIKEIAAEYHAGKQEEKRFTIALSVEDNALLESVAKKLNASKREVIAKLLPPALRDLEIELERKE